MDKKHIWFNWLNNGGGAGATQTEAKDRFGDSLIWEVEPSLMQPIRQEALTANAFTLADEEDDVVGMIQELQYGHWIQAASTGVRPKMGFGTGRNAYLKHDGTNDWLQVENSLGIFRQLWSPNPVGCLAFWIKKGADGTAMTWICSNSSTGGQTGIKVSFTSGNKVSFWITKHSPNVTIINYTSTASVVVADGWVPVVCNLNDVGVGNFSMYINGTLDGTGTILAGVNQDASQILRIGEVNDGTADFNGHWGTFLILDEIMTADDIAWFGSYDNSVDTELHPFIPYMQFDFSDATKMFTERSSPSTNVASNDDPIGYVQNQVSYSFGVLNRDANAPSDAKRPLYKTSVENSLSASFFDGDVSFQELNHNRWPRGGNLTWFHVVRFTPTEGDLTEGRKTRSDGAAGATSGTNYHTLTAYDDDSNTPPLAGYGTAAGENYSVMHHGGAASGIVAANPDANNLEIFAYWYNGSSLKVYNRNGFVTEWTVTGTPFFTKIGGIADTWTNNRIAEDNLFMGIPGGRSSKAQAAIISLINGLGTKWGVPTS